MAKVSRSSVPFEVERVGNSLGFSVCVLVVLLSLSVGTAPFSSVNVLSRLSSLTLVS